MEAGAHSRNITAALHIVFQVKVVHQPSVDITCHVLKALCDESLTGKEPFIESALNWLVSAQNKDGSLENDMVQRVMSMQPLRSCKLHCINLGSKKKL